MREFRFTEQVLNSIHEQALAEYPAECCGWVTIDKAGNQNYVPSVNLQDKYHRLDPEQYPRTSKEAFLMDVLKLSRSVEEVSAGGGRLFSIVHSHIDCPAYFSDEDKRQMSRDGAEIFPADCYLVVSIDQRRVDGHAVFHYDAASRDFAEGKIVRF